jgi:hypothetical protein
MSKPRITLGLAGLVVSILIVAAGSTLRTPVALTPDHPFGPCGLELPATNSMTKAIERAEEVLQACSGGQERVFLHLLDVGRKRPGIENREEIVDLYERMIRFEVVNAREANELLTQYLYVRFAAVDGVNERFSSLSDRALIRLSRAIEDELALKKIGLDEVAGRADQYERARDYAQRMQDLLESTRIQWDYMRSTESAQR